MSNRFSRVLVGGALAVMATAAGCDSGVSIDDLADTVIANECTREYRCGRLDDVATCIAENQLVGGYAGSVRSLVAAVDAGKIIYDGDAAEACWTLGRTATCGSGSYALNDDPCADMFRGTLALNAACELDEECASGSCYQINCAEDACCAGTCVAADPPPVAGDICDGPGLGAPRYCGATMYCDIDGTKQCTPWNALPAGAACSPTQVCDFSLACLGTPATCKAIPVVGETCLDATNAVACDQGLACDPATNKCRAAVRPGDACDPTDFTTCEQLGMRCGDTSHVCERAPKLGEPCSGGYPGYSGWCAAGTYCEVPGGASDGTCAAPKPNATACVNDDECDSGRCYDAVCTDPLVCF